MLYIPKERFQCNTMKTVNQIHQGACFRLFQRLQTLSRFMEKTAHSCTQCYYSGIAVVVVVVIIVVAQNMSVGCKAVSKV